MDNKKIGMMVAIGVTILVAGYLLWGFSLLFILLTIIYAVIGLVIIKYGTDDPQSHLEDNNTPFWIGLGAFAVTLLIACFNFGPALLLPEEIPSPEQRNVLSNFFNHLLHGNNAVESTTSSKKPLPWATGTWFWWKAMFLYFWLTFGYSFFAFWDEAKDAYEKRKKYLEEKEKEKPKEAATHPPAPGGPTTEPAEKKQGFGGRLLVEFIAEIFAELVVHWVTRRRGNI